MKSPIRSLFLFLTLLVVAVLALSVQASNRSKRKTFAAQSAVPSVAPAAPLGPACTLPGVSVITDPAGDVTPVQNAKQDLLGVSFAEPYAGGASKLYVTMQIADLSGTLPPSTIYRTYFTFGATIYWVDMETDATSTVSFHYGTRTNGTPASDTTVSTADPSSTYSATNGTITVVVPNCNVGSPTAGSTLTSIFARTIVQAGVLLVTVDDETNQTGAKAYTLVGNNSCQGTAAAPNPCIPPGVTVLTDYIGDATDKQPGHDIQSVSVAEPNFGDGVNRLVFTIKMANLSTLPPNTRWPVQFLTPFEPTPSTGHWVDMVTDTTQPSGVSFRYGTFTINATGAYNSPATVVGNADPGSGYNRDGTITIVIADSKLGIPTPLFGALKGFLMRVRVTGQAADLTPDNAPDSVTPGCIAYTLVGSTSCPFTAPGSNQPRFFTYLSPSGVADSAGEPSIGSNWTKEAINHNHHVDGSPDNNIPNGGTSLYFGGFLPAMAKVTWDDCSSPAGTLWENKKLVSANTARVFGDPILFTDHDTGRTFAAQLEGLTPAGSTIDITDNDGDMFTPSDGVVPSDVDHETIGGGHYHSPLPNPNPVYPDAIYYASQSVAEARAFRSDNGGFLFSQANAPMFTVNDCSGLHGHIKVSPADGTVYVPDKGCGGITDLTNPNNLRIHEASKQAVIRSDNNGLTWTVFPVSTSTGNGETDNPADGSHQTKSDPSVGIATDGTLYFGYQANDGHPHIAVSTDKGVTWSNDTDVGATVVNGGPVLNTTFPAVVAGDPNRAAFAFFGSETGGTNFHCGNGETCAAGDFPGVWYLYVATTFDGGTTWVTQNITPGDPIQRGGICGGGTCRNLLDFFDATIDKDGRVLVGYDDGCITAGCITGTSGNDFTSKGAIARHSGGKRMFAVFDPVEPALAGAPKVTGSLDSTLTTATLSWPTPDNSGSPITGYNVYREAGKGSFSLIANTPVTTFVDSGLNPSTTYTYRVTAVNGIGEGPYCPDVTPVFVKPPTSCVLPGILAVNDLNPDGSDNDSGQNTPPDPRVNIRQLFLAEPCLGGANKLVFTMQLAPSPTLTTAPASSQWYIVWNRPAGAPDTGNFDRWWVGMKSDAAGNLSFVYGKWGVPTDPTNPNPNTNTPVVVGNADSGTANFATGVVTIVLDTSKAENIAAGQSLSALNVRTFFGRPDAGPKPQSSASDITVDGIYTLVGNNSCCPQVPLLGVASRKTHGSAGTFDVGLPLTGPVGVECRTGQPSAGNHSMVFTFATPLTSVSSAAVTSGTGSVASSMIGTDPHEYIVNLAGVTNAQRLTVTLTNVADTAGDFSASIGVTMGVLLGDVNGNGLVNSTDTSLVQAQSGQAVTTSNFRTDVNANGLINSTDTSIVQAQSGTGLP